MLAENLKLAGGLGLPSNTQPPSFSPEQVEEAAAFLASEGYAVIRDALSAEDVRFLNGFCDRTMNDHPYAWGFDPSKPIPEASKSGLSYNLPLLDHPELDRFVQHRGTYPLVERVLGDPRLAEFNIRNAKAGWKPSVMMFHRDRWPRLPQEKILPYLCSIHYLTDVSAETPSFCVVPRTMAFSSLGKARKALGDAYVEQPIYGPAGTCVMYDIALIHTRLHGDSSEHLERRTLHTYFARGGNDSQKPAPVLTDWNLIPKRLAMHPDAATRRFYSHWNTGMCEWAADDFSLELRARNSKAVGVEFRGFGSKEEKQAFLAEAAKRRQERARL
eukprot:gnl/TRDRNA2_/TRDRNA2_91447_c0_seq1.p1 gnl/TRDRNA2_/TRDRNA2_91447_c0~~gnl/TRDRNA2_/TRDRNA2_91447_c0_seq1.p1  ORF type:complete len:330 (+),score=47.01 gnl/TRDRNA2_/TRDRNA2_91447_c0_seq1:117-1106(+)